MWGAQPEGVVAALDLFDDGAHVGEGFLVADGGQPVAADDAVEFGLRGGPDLRVGGDQGAEPLHY